MTIPDDSGMLTAVLEEMFVSNTTITARAVTRQSGSPFKNASDITRHVHRRTLLKQFQDRQKTVRQLAEYVDKESVTNLRLKVARLEEACTALRRSKELLIASHKAMLLSVGEIGGMRAWVKFFPRWDEVRQSLIEMDAMPNQATTFLDNFEQPTKAVEAIGHRGT